MISKETIRDIIASAGADVASNIVRCGECPYGNECTRVDAPTCSLTLKECNINYIKELSKLQGENNMATILPNNTVQINPQGEVEGLGSLSLEDLAKLSNAARDLLERKSDEHEQQLWDNVVKAVKEYCEDFGDIVILLDGDDNLEFNHNQMDCRGEIDCA